MPTNRQSPTSRTSPGRRRQFFRQVLHLGLDGIESAGRKLAQQLAAAGIGHKDSPSSKKRLLRPPGALPEPAFSQTCRRCGDCVRVCPAQCIVVDSTIGGGTPHIVARQSPCVICEDLSCMKACPTGALVLVDQMTQIQMGVAVVDQLRCLRSSDAACQSEDPTTLLRANCRVCVDDCPLGDWAIGIDDQGLVQVRQGCTGCGVCERVCPTESASIIVIPR